MELGADYWNVACRGGAPLHIDSR